MAANDLPLNLILRRSVTEGFLKEDDPELALHQSLSNDSSRLEDEENSAPLDTTSSSRLPLSQDPTIYYHKIGLSSTRRRSKSSRSQSLNTINTRRTSQNYGDSAEIYRTPVSGYGLNDCSTSEDDDYSDDTSDSEEEAYPVAPHRFADQRKKLGGVSSTADSAHYVALITGRMDPWEIQMQKLQEEGKDLAPQIADKITKDFKTLEKPSSASAITWARDNEDIIQRIKSMSLETEAIKERRKKEIDTKNQNLAKEIEACIQRVTDEREAALRIREEALKQAQLEKERIAKEQEEKAKAAAAQKDAQEKRTAEAAAAAAEKAKKAAAAAAEKASTNTSAIFISEAADVEYKQYLSVLEHIRTVVLPAVSGNPTLKKYCYQARRDIVAAIGQLINKQSEIFRVATEIDKIFKTTQSQNVVAYNWVLNCTAKKLVKQAETEALVKSAPAFPLAHVAVLLISNHARFLDVLMARFAKKCPYVTPMYIAKDPTDSADQFLEKLAYKKTDKGYETESQYNARQCAMFTLYCAVMQTTPPVGNNMYPMSHGWTWMARILNMPPRPITPALITVFLEVCGSVYLRMYQNQATKVIKLLYNDFIPLIPRQGIDGTTRLKTLLEEEFIKKGQIPVAPGRNYDN
ncbi:GLE1-like protein-domain-containing protein [Gamsiella multidivaricata]|uniref:GLE1-like protein-domain-containing protein n=1 Tax=Gamsiella multidivaricata TaxID=101098 RepID=UPI00221F893B|nr:GLE1-like protein-domain-containing protein [Gamsiella multidivaricata]KAG0366832.1 hypothetical protein BGZ54_004827 [Gamsiella multidivaricata]KAI7828974.1 GLE1-like protein-domain-containing protein [Gamsiella multidivaricata]